MKLQSKTQICPSPGGRVGVYPATTALSGREQCTSSIPSCNTLEWKVRHLPGTEYAP